LGKLDYVAVGNDPRENQVILISSNKREIMMETVICEISLATAMDVPNNMVHN
jgi:hypothetical protein